MKKYIFRRDTPEPATIMRKQVIHRRKDMTPLISLFSDRDKSRFARKLFRNDLSQFNTFMQQLDTKMTWHEVFQTIETELNTRRIDMGLEEARQMTDRIYMLFFPDDISIGA